MIQIDAQLFEKPYLMSNKPVSASKESQESTSAPEERVKLFESTVNIE